MGINYYIDWELCSKILKETYSIPMSSHSIQNIFQEYIDVDDQTKNITNELYAKIRTELGKQI